MYVIKNYIWLNPPSPRSLPELCAYVSWPDSPNRPPDKTDTFLHLPLWLSGEWLQIYEDLTWRWDFPSFITEMGQSEQARWARQDAPGEEASPHLTHPIPQCTAHLTNLHTPPKPNFQSLNNLRNFVHLSILHHFSIKKICRNLLYESYICLCQLTCVWKG